VKKAGDFRRGAVRILTMRKVADAREESQIQICECLAQAVEEEQPDQSLRGVARQRLHGRASHIVPDQSNALKAKGIDERKHLRRVAFRPERAGRLVAVAEAP
jgi:hypothetical protein